MPRFRFRMLTLIVAVAVVGVALGGWKSWRRWERLRTVYSWNAGLLGLGEQMGRIVADSEDASASRLEEMLRSQSASQGTDPASLEPANLDEEVKRRRDHANMMRIKANGAGELKAQYERAMSSYWAPRPPEE